MRDLDQRIFQRFKKILPSILFVASVVLLITTWISLQRHVSVGIATQRQLHALAAATKNFHDDFNRWPTNLTELRSNTSQKTPFRSSIIDRWRRPYIFIPPSSNSPGKIQTFGADGNPNGDKTDGDAAIAIK